MMPYALGGAWLEGSKLVRLTYIDESGTNPRDPCLVVAGVIINGDTQLNKVDDHLRALVVKHIPPADRPEFFFHGTDIWNGNGYFKGKEQEWPRERRNALLMELASIPGAFRLPIAFGLTRRKTPMFAGLPADLSPDALRAVTHLSAFVAMAKDVDRAFRTVWPNENTLLIAEDIPEMKKTLRVTQAYLRDRHALRAMNWLREGLPLIHIKDTVHFAAKADSRPLQLADVCAFVVRGLLSGKNAYRPYHDALTPQMVAYPEAEIAYYRQAQETFTLQQTFSPWEA